MEDDAGEDDLGAVVGGLFGEPCCQATELFEPVEPLLDHVAELVEVGVEGRWPATVPRSRSAFLVLGWV
ncbi:hypothetical protein SD37_19765 [Amycolatopsis orientalis]|uniref:Uncharacterized protein n=1 Tax=Amycolatopsis orientalis TaxID=31958 RepID=A0A193BZL3_AMYOR|nr:hypothetical protein SD37_19765 [Amycolatopsis orientalis]